MPPPVAIPFLALADIFGLPTTATYAGLNLWNFAPISPNVSLCDPDNLRSLCTFTGTRDEEWFYLISVAMEARGGSIIPNMMRAVDAVVADDPAVITSVLLNLAETLKMLGDLLDRMYEHCDPYIFYYQIRPFLAGSKNMSVAGLPQGVFYDEGEGKGQWRMYSGGSNAQSSLIQFFDVILGIQHKSTGESGSKSSVNSNAFLQVRKSRDC
jgi:indoleamine 2,3-dioxygenase